MKRILVLGIALVLTGLVATTALGGDIGARAAAMGGAYTAVADDGTAPYWNPAGITQIKYLTLTPAVGLGGDFSSLFDILDGTVTDFVEFETTGSAMAGLTTRWVGFNYLADFNATGKGDSSDWQGTAWGQGFGVLTIAGTFGKNLSVGINCKMMKAEYGNVHAVTLGQGSFSADASGYFYDLGVLYKVNNSLKLGLMGRNLAGNIKWNNSSYETLGPVPPSEPTPPEGLDKTYVAGLAYSPYKSLVIAADFENIDAVNDDYDEFRRHLGLEQALLWNSIKLRLGAFTKNDSYIRTAGLGLKLGPILLDIGAQYAEEISGFATAGLKF